MAKFFEQFDNRHSSVTGVLRFMEFEHLSDPKLQALSREFASLAWTLIQALPDDPELIAALNKLREAKDRAVGLAAVTRSEVAEYHTLGEFCAATTGPEHDEAVEATLQWMVAELSKEADDRERIGAAVNGLHFSVSSVRGLVADKADLIHRYRAMNREASCGY